jgi:hypothetical protein
VQIQNVPVHILQPLASYYNETFTDNNTKFEKMEHESLSDTDKVEVFVFPTKKMLILGSLQTLGSKYNDALRVNFTHKNVFTKKKL